MKSKGSIGVGIIMTALFFSACGQWPAASVQSADTKAVQSPLENFVERLQTELEANPKVTSINQQGDLDGTYQVLLSTGKQLSIQWHAKDMQSNQTTVFDNFQVDDGTPQDGKDATCLQVDLADAKASGYTPKYAGVLFSDTTMFFGYGADQKQFLTYDLATAECYASWKK